MSTLFGDIRQCGYVVEDLEEALKYWIEQRGVGPWFRLPVQFGTFKYKGKEIRPEIKVALANWGPMQIELIQPLDDVPSPYRNFLQKKGSGLHHTSAWAEDFDGDVKRLAELGHHPDLIGQIANGGVRFVFYDSAATDGTTVEISDRGGLPATKEMLDMIHQASVNWDGKNPIRTLG